MAKEYMSREDMLDIIIRKNMQGYDFKMPRKGKFAKVIIECNALASGLPDYEYGKDNIGYYKLIIREGI